MGHDFRPEFASASVLAFPLFLECDRAGQVVWMSETSRQRLNATEGLTSAISAFARFAVAQQIQRVGSLLIRFTLVLDMPNSLLVSAEVLQGSSATSGSEVAGTLRLLRGMIRNILHLQTIHLRLTARVSRRKRGGGRQVVEHLEMLRKRLALDLHTGVGQHLTAIGLQLDSIDRAKLELPAPVPTALSTIRQSLSDAREETRSLSHQLNPPQWQMQTVAEALEQLWLASGFPQLLGDNAVLRVERLPVEPSHNFKTVLYRAAQEALKNVAEHSGARQVTMTLEQAPHGYRLAVEDDGKGFDLGEILQRPASLDKGIGLSSIRELVYANGGEFRVISGGGTTTIETILPLKDPGEE